MLCLPLQEILDVAPSRLKLAMEALEHPGGVGMYIEDVLHLQSGWHNPQSDQCVPCCYQLWCVPADTNRKCYCSADAWQEPSILNGRFDTCSLFFMLRQHQGVAQQFKVDPGVHKSAWATLTRVIEAVAEKDHLAPNRIHCRQAYDNIINH